MNACRLAHRRERWLPHNPIVCWRHRLWRRQIACREVTW